MAAFFTPTEVRVIIKVIQNVANAPNVFVDLIEVDVSQSEDHLFNGEISKIPIEDGSKLSDHKSIDPISLEFNLLFSDTPISKFNPLKPLEGSEGLARKTVQKIIGYQRDIDKELIIVSGFAAYNNMAVESVGVIRRGGDGKGVACRVVFAEIPRVSRGGTGGASITTTVIGDVKHTAFGVLALGDLT